MALHVQDCPVIGNPPRPAAAASTRGEPKGKHSPTPWMPPTPPPQLAPTPTPADYSVRDHMRPIEVPL
eukprot:11428305-Alexandrium_andersonii.AAC.1